MKYNNPVIPGFYPDPSICTDGNKYYLVNSTFQYFPGVVLFESEDLIHWIQIGHVLTRESQLPLDNCYKSGGIYAPTIRYDEKDKTFYMITTNVSGGGNFIVHTKDIYGEWSDPVWIPQQGIDPSLLFDGDKCYFIGNGQDENNRFGLFMNEINPLIGENITDPVCAWRGTGGRYLEGPHIYKIGEYYYLMAAEGGTEYGHMEIISRSKTPYGPYENSPYNPILTNRNLGGFKIQGVGHGDLIQDKAGNWWIVCLAYRQFNGSMYHTTGRETYLVPASFDKEGWLHAGTRADGVVLPKEPIPTFFNFNLGERDEGVVLMEYDLPGRSYLPVSEMSGSDFDKIPFSSRNHLSFNNTKINREWITLRKPLKDDELVVGKNGLDYTLKGNESSIDDPLGTPSLIAIRQQQMEGEFIVNINLEYGEAGAAVYMDEGHHYDLRLSERNGKISAILRLRIGDVIQKKETISLGKKKNATVKICFDEYYFSFMIEEGEEFKLLSKLQSKYLTSEVAGGFTGNMFVLFAEPDGKAKFNEFEINYLTNK